ncbi:hypothetical protein GCM10023093_00100 [Nemorincola caseinilytica]|uniref:HTH luxR-type domain-containing protein n=1 Tax=Nemorincola caseinilytica TaxID=2054315 RepID=A0ABP8N2H4_9BACT
MKSASIFKNADRIWKGIAKDTEEDELNFDLEVHKKLLSIFQVGDYYYYIFNIRRSAIEYMSDGIATLLGHDPKAVDVPYLLTMIHPEDQPWFLNFEHKVGEFFATLSPDEVMNYKVRYDYRIRRADGTYIRVLQQVVTIQHDGVNLLRSLGVHTDISHLKPDGIPVLSFIGMNGAPSYINVDVKKVFAADTTLSVREQEILRLLIEGMTSVEIAAEFSISKLTVDTHRKNLLRKYGCRNTAELISYAITSGLT